jgi:hypothetical protein
MLIPFTIPSWPWLLGSTPVSSLPRAAAAACTDSLGTYLAGCELAVAHQFTSVCGMWSGQVTEISINRLCKTEHPICTFVLANSGTVILMGTLSSSAIFVDLDGEMYL